MFQSMTTITLTTIAVTFLIVLWATHHNPLNTLFRFLSALRHDRLLLFHVLAALAVLLLNKLELKLEQVLHWPLDFTPYVYRLEGAFIPFIQHSFEVTPCHGSFNIFLHYRVHESARLLPLRLFSTARLSRAVHALVRHHAELLYRHPLFLVRSGVRNVGVPSRCGIFDSSHLSVI